MEPVSERADPPRWLLALALTLAGGMLAFGWVGLLLAANGWCRPILVFPLGTLAWVGIVALARPALPARRTSRRGAHVAAGIGVAAIAVITCWNGAHASQHVMIDRDGGSYMNTGRWIARTGGLDVHPRVGPFAHEPLLSFKSQAVYEMSDGSLQFQFAHFLPALLGEAHDVGGDFLMFHLVELLSGVALLAFFVLAWRLFRHPWFALAAALTLAFVVPQVSFSRDSYSEIPSQVLLFTAIWLLSRNRLLSQWRIALAAGLFLGAIQTTRIDALAIFVGIPVLVGVAWRLADREGTDRHNVKRAVAALVIGLVPGVVLGFIDLTRHAGFYFDLLSSQVHQLLIAIVASAVVTLCVVVAWPRMQRTARPRQMRVVAASAAVSVLAVGFVTWAFRPSVNDMRGPALPVIRSLQSAEGQIINGTHYYFEYSLTWMSWYLGPITLAAAIIGAALLLRSLLLGRCLRAIPAVSLLAFETLVYLWKASAVPDHVWIDRRFLSTTIPALILLALGLATFAWRRRGRGRIWTRVASVAIAVVAVAYPVYTVAPIASMSEERGYLLPLRDACNLLGPRAAVVVLHSSRDPLVLDGTGSQALRGWCGAEVASMQGKEDAATLLRLSREWSAAGRKLFVVALSADTIRAALPGIPVSSTRVATNRKRLRPTLTKRPSQYKTQTFSMVVAAVPNA